MSILIGHIKIKRSKMARKNLKFKKRSGISLIELIIYLSITMIVLVVIIDIVTRIVQNRSVAVGQAEITSNARFLVDKLSYSVQSAKSIDGSYPADSLNLSVDTNTQNYFLQDGQIFYRENGGSSIAITDSQVLISSIDTNENIFNKITNTDAQSLIVRFKMTFKENNFNKDFEVAILTRGK
jgi:Tfp pilus assembly protein PilW